MVVFLSRTPPVTFRPPYRDRFPTRPKPAGQYRKTRWLFLQERTNTRSLQKYDVKSKHTSVFYTFSMVRVWSQYSMTAGR